MDTPESIQELLIIWDRRVLKAADAHYECARHFSGWNVRLGVPTVILAAIVCGLAFATVAGSMSFWVQTTIGFLAVIQTVLSSLHTWRRDSEVSEKHRLAAAQYAAIRRHIEQLRVSGGVPSEAALSEVRTQIDSLSSSAPTIPPLIWKRTQFAFGGYGTAGGAILGTSIAPTANPVLSTDTRQAGSASPPRAS